MIIRNSLCRALCLCLCMMVLLSCRHVEIVGFNDGWKFVRDSLAGAEAVCFDDSGWYRKSFRLPRADAGKTVRLVFDGAYMETDVWVNGSPMTWLPSGRRLRRRGAARLSS